MTVLDATDEEIARVCLDAAEAADALAWAPHSAIATLLGASAEELEAMGSELVKTADAETSLGAERLGGELARTCSQLRAFGELVSSGGHVEPIISPATENTPDLRRMMVPVGPVAVFGASNFPLAFSVPGGDTASALAAGCPVVAKGHPSHPKTSELCAESIARAVKVAGLPHGAFSMVQGAARRVGQALVEAPQIRAVGFTGSHAAGRALYELAARRPVPIPVYAEMGSLNPVLVTAAAIEARGPLIAAELAASITVGCGQFCTKPGLVFAPPSESFSDALSEAIGSVPAAQMLNKGIADGFTHAVERTMALDGVGVLAGKPGPGQPVLLSTTLEVFLERPELVEEHFGPASILVGCSEDRMGEALGNIEGTLSVSVYAEAADDDLIRRLIPTLVGRAGRIVFDGPPTGVAVVPAMVHGGPYPATTSPTHTSVGLSSIRRFQRPVAFQNVPTRLLPNALREEPQ